jgi:chorismate mutase
MDPRKEALSLKEFPLPEEVEISPTSIATLDNSIETLEKEISKLNIRLTELVNDRARIVNSVVKSGSMEDQNYKIVEVVKYGNRVCDPKKLEKLSPVLWETYKELYAEKARRDADDIIQKAKENVETKVLLSIADDVFGKQDVTLCSQVPATIKYEVRKK